MQPYDPFQQQQQPYSQQPQQPYYQQQPQWGQQPGMMPPRRSAIPKVIGILMIIFGGLGLLGGLVGLVSSSALSGMSEFGRHSSYYGGSSSFDNDFSILNTYATFSKVTTVLGLLIAGLELFAGIALVGYKQKGLTMAKTYAIVNMVTSVLTMILVFAWLKPALSHTGMGGIIGAGMLAGTFLALAWPTVVLVLTSRPAAKDACTNL